MERPYIEPENFPALIGAAIANLKSKMGEELSGTDKKYLETFQRYYSGTQGDKLLAATITLLSSEDIFSERFTPYMRRTSLNKFEMARDDLYEALKEGKTDDQIAADTILARRVLKDLTYLRDAIRSSYKNRQSYQKWELVTLIIIGISSLLLGYLGISSNSIAGKIIVPTGYNLPVVLGLLFIISISLFTLYKKSSHI